MILKLICKTPSELNSAKSWLDSRRVPWERGDDELSLIILNDFCDGVDGDAHPMKTEPTMTVEQYTALPLCPRCGHRRIHCRCAAVRASTPEEIQRRRDGAMLCGKLWLRKGVEL